MANAAVLLRRILLRLQQAEMRETWEYRDDLTIARITVALTLREFCPHNSELPFWYIGSPHEAATRAVLELHPDQVWPAVVATRKARMGREYSLWYDDRGNRRFESLEPLQLPPKKPVQMVLRFTPRSGKAQAA